MPTSVRAPIIQLPQSLDGLAWKGAKEYFDQLEASPLVETAPPEKEVISFTKKCAKKYSNELNILFVRIHLLFHKHLPQAKYLRNGVNFLKYRLSALDPQELQIAKRNLSEALPDGQTPAEAPPIKNRLTKATQKLLFLQRLVERLPKSIFQRENEAIRDRAEALYFKYQELVNITTTVDEVRQVQACIARIKDLDERRNALFEELKTLGGKPSEYHQLIQLQNAFDQIRLDFINLSKRVDILHKEYPSLFTLDLQTLGNAIRKDNILVMRLLSSSAPAPMQSIAYQLRKTLSQTSFQDLLAPENDTRICIGHLAFHYKSFNHLPDLPEEYEKAYILDATIKSYKGLQGAIKNNSYFQSFKNVDLLEKELDTEDLAPLRDLFETHALPFIQGRTPQMQRLLLQKFDNLFSQCPSLCSPVIQTKLKKIASQLPPNQDVDHERHKRELRENMTKETRIDTLFFFFKKITSNTLETVSEYDITQFRDVLCPDYTRFQDIISYTIQNFSKQHTKNNLELVRFIGYIQEMIKHCPQLDAGSRLSDQITSVLRYHIDAACLLRTTHFRFYEQKTFCNSCIKEKILFDQWETLTQPEVDRLRDTSPEQTFFKDHLQRILDTYTRNQLLLWKEDHFDPFIKRCDESKNDDINVKLSDLKCVKDFIAEVTFRITPPSFWDWLVVLFGDLLRLFRH